jgi:hypothetical protein
MSRCLSIYKNGTICGGAACNIKAHIDQCKNLSADEIKSRKELLKVTKPGLNIPDPVEVGISFEFFTSCFKLAS